MQTIGFIGLRHMGGNMAARYLAADYTVYGEERDREETRWLTSASIRDLTIAATHIPHGIVSHRAGSTSIGRTRS